VHPRHIQLAISVAKAAGIPEDKVYVLGGRFQGRKSLDDLIKDAQTKKLAPLAVRPAKKDTLAYLVFSSGTTGLPKGSSFSRFQRWAWSENIYSSCHGIAWQSRLRCVSSFHPYDGNSLCLYGNSLSLSPITGT
jgi:long-subunit acyl-CoA synthetase (AMP-forming)